MPVLRFRFLIAVLTAFAATIPRARAEDSHSMTPAQIIAAIERADSGDTNIYGMHDFHVMHGNANSDLQRLMILRFEATQAIMESIDRMDGDPTRAALQSALYGVLGFVKDPASIDWLRGKLRSDQAEAFYRHYLPTWQTRLDGFGSWEWLTGRDKWIAFWRDAFDAERSPERRAELLCVLCHFDDASVVMFFEGRRTAATDPKEALIVESYLDAHDIAADDKRVQWAVDSLTSSQVNLEFLISMARGLRHQAFVPFLVGISDIVDPNTTPAYYPAERALQPITFECNMHGKVAWQRWFTTHGKEGRRAWTQRDLNAFHETLARNTADAVKEFDHRVYCWNEIALLPFIESDLLPHAEFHSDIAGWINLTYTDFYRERLRPLAERLGRSGHLDDVAQRLLQERGYLPGSRKPDWAKTVEYANSRL